ncbi:MAG TPA: hypothetical protein VKY51_06960 [Fredinandcohnia sp.]|nr:hypothetical protein [Fredinandcohnia sp.]
MFALIRWAFLCFLAVVAGVVAVSIPIGERTLAERIRDLAADVQVENLASQAAKKALAKLAEDEAPPAEDLTDEDREALEAILEKRADER